MYAFILNIYLSILFLTVAYFTYLLYNFSLCYVFAHVIFFTYTCILKDDDSFRGDCFL